MAFTLAISPLVAQTVPESKPLTEVLLELQQRFSYQFNYAPDMIKDIKFSGKTNFSSIEDAIVVLKEKTGLVFTFLADNYISVRIPEGRVCGFLLDNNTGNPVSSAAIKYGSKYVISDEDGFFEFSLTKLPKEIVISHIGYHTLSQDFNLTRLNKCDQIFLIPDEQKLEEIVLYDFLIRGMDKLDNGAFRINFEESTILPGLIQNDVLQSVQALPGIQSINETVSNINIRGGTNDQNLILWDNIKMYQSGHFFGLISMYNPDITQKVYVRKNGTPASLTDGVSGTIVMETDKNINEEFKGTAGFNFTDAHGIMDVPLGKKSSIQIAARKSISDWVETPTYNSYFDRISQDTEIEDNSLQISNSDKSFDFYDVSVRWLYKPTPRDRFRMNFITTDNSLIFNENALIDRQEITRQSSLKQNTIAGGLEYQRNWSEGFITLLEIYNTDYILRAINANIPNDQRFLQENKVSETGSKISSSFKLNSAFTLTTGYQLTETKVSNLDDVDNPIFRRLEAEVLRTHSGFSELKFQSNSKETLFNLGLRYNYLSKFKKSIWEPRLSFNQRFLRFFNLELLGELKHQNTSQIINFQNDFLGVEKRRWQLTDNQNIPVIQSEQASIGLSFIYESWLLNVVGYYKNVDGITSQSQGFLDQYQFIRTRGSYNTSGIDFLVRKQVNNVSSWLSYSFMQNNYLFPSISVTEFPSNYDIPHAISAGLSLDFSSVQLSGGIHWHSGRPFTEVQSTSPLIGNTIQYQSINRARLNDYLRLDISAIYDFQIGQRSKGKIGISVWNLLNRQNTINTYFTPQPPDNVEQNVLSSLGITPNALLRISI